MKYWIYQSGGQIEGYGSGKVVPNGAEEITQSRLEFIRAQAEADHAKNWQRLGTEAAAFRAERDAKAQVDAIAEATAPLEKRLADAGAKNEEMANLLTERLASLEKAMAKNDDDAEDDKPKTNNGVGNGRDEDE